MRKSSAFDKLSFEIKELRKAVNDNPAVFDGICFDKKSVSIHSCGDNSIFRRSILIGVCLWILKSIGVHS